MRMGGQTGGMSVTVLGVAGLLGAVLVLLAVGDGDTTIARTFFFDEAAGHWIGRHDWWANGLLHTGGRAVMRAVGLGAIVAWAASFRVARLAPYRGALGCFAACMVIVPLSVGLLKPVTDVDCPWDLQGFGGTRPVIHWFQDRPDGLPRAACFPGAHSSSAFALFSLFFLWHPTRPRLAWTALAATVLIGALFSIAQQARGAHFLSHDVASALIAWLLCHALTRPAFKRSDPAHPVPLSPRSSR